MVADFQYTVNYLRGPRWAGHFASDPTFIVGLRAEGPFGSTRAHRRLKINRIVMGVDLDGGEAPMTQQNLHGARVVAFGQGCGGEKMPELVGRDEIRDSGNLAVFLDHRLDGADGHSPVLAILE